MQYDCFRLYKVLRYNGLLPLLLQRRIKWIYMNVTISDNAILGNLAKQHTATYTVYTADILKISKTHESLQSLLLSYTYIKEWIPNKSIYNLVISLHYNINTRKTTALPLRYYLKHRTERQTKSDRQ